MKVLKGYFQGIELSIPNSGAVRLTTDHFKKNILADLAVPPVVWDLFAGSGGVGIEFLSQGSSEVVFVEERNDAFSCLKSNLGECQIKNRTQFLKQKVLTFKSMASVFLGDIESHRELTSPNLIFFDPPSDGKWINATLNEILNCNLVANGCLVLIQHEATEQLTIESKNWYLKNQKLYGSKTLSLLNLTK